jgi:sugar phosphate isomerase/epimerase
MPRYGICTSLANAAAVRQAGWDFVEENVQTVFRGTEPDEKYTETAQLQSAALPVSAANCLVPGNLKITGPAVDREALRSYMANVLRRAGQVGCRTLVFGSGGARQIPEGWDKARATDQIIDFGKMIARMAHEQGVTIALEHLCLKECNIVNTLAEELHITRAVKHANFQCLVDTYHLWTDGIPLSELEPLLPYIRHVHLADKDGRVPPGQSGTSDYRPVFAMLKKAGYNGALSVEATGFGDLAGLGPKVLAFLKKQWSEA